MTDQDNTSFWQTKLHARLHDPAEKALVLLRDPAGHEGGSSRALHRLLGYQRLDVANLDPDNADVLHTALFHHGIPAPIYETVRRADWWAAAADRPQWPMQEITITTRKGEQRTLKVADHAQVRWTNKPVLIHPLTAKEFDLGRSGGLGDTDLTDLKSRSFEHFADLVQRQGDGTPDWQRTLLAYWRFGPELREEEDNGKLGMLWPLLPADTRVPDHSIWDHLDLTSAFAGAFAGDPDGEVALLTMALGPVQSFIAAARTTSDLWAGSHLLSRLAWEAMKPVCEALGPDAILFPRLRGVPQVDVWLREECGLPGKLFADAPWTEDNTDANPLFAAALPNRFVALVPRAQAAALARQVEDTVRGWLKQLGDTVVDRLLVEAGMNKAERQHCHQQMRGQLAGFPEVHWAAVPFSLIRPRNAERQTDLDTTQLSQAMAPFFGVQPGQPAGFLNSPVWKVLQAETKWDDRTTFFAPNPGALYPAVQDLAERVLAAAKSVRPFAQTEQTGWRCSLTGETEWLTTDPAHLNLTATQRKTQRTLWTEIARRRPAWARKGEHLGALPALKRLWPTIFAEEVGQVLGDCDSARRFVISTHTMALAHQIDRWLADGAKTTPELTRALAEHGDSPVALPRQIMRKYARQPQALERARRLPGLLDAAAELDDEAQAKALRQAVQGALGSGADDRVETYYSLVLMDGDRMGAWLAGGDEYAITYGESFHPQVRKVVEQQASRQSQKLLKAYVEQKRAVSPNRHLAISGALNDFSLHVVPHVVETEFPGRLIYAGGDDVLAMLPVADLLPAMQRLRVAYAGHDPQHEQGDRSQALTLHEGFALLQTRQGPRLLRMMGDKATASCGAVVAHHQAPLGAVMRELRAAEQRAKGVGERDAFSLTLVKRSGGTLSVTAKWGEPATLLHDLRGFLRHEGVSRRAVYNSLDWLKDLPHDRPEMLASLLAYQLDRQSDRAAQEAHDVPGLARRLAALAFDDAAHPETKPKSKPDANKQSVSRSRLDWLANFMGVAEFLARDTRSGA